MSQDFSKYLNENKRLSKKVKIIIWVVIGLLLLLLLRGIFKSAGEKKAAAEKEKTQREAVFAIPVKVQKILSEDIQEIIDTNADIEGIERATLYSDYPGKIVSLYVSEGQNVSKGQTLAMMNQDVVVKRFADYPIKTLISGIVAKIFLKPGETVSPSLPVITVENINKVKCLAKVSEKNLNKVKIGNQAEIRVDSYPNQVFSGKISEISPVLDSMSRSAEVTILVDNYKYPKTPLKPGMYAEVKIIVRTLEKELLVPYSAILKDDATGKSFVFIYRNNLAKKIYVTPGILKSYGEDTAQDKLQVKGDLQAGDYVVYVGHQFLNDNDKIRFIYENQKYGPSGLEGEVESEASLEKRKQILQEKIASLRKNTQDFPTMEKLAETSFIFGFFFTDTPEQKKKMAMEVKDLGERLIKSDDKKAAGYYWLAASRLLLASLPPEMRSQMEKFNDIKEAKLELEKVLILDEKYFESGAYRSLAILYNKVPVAPFNDKGKALDYLKKAVELSPNNKWNYQFLAEMLIENKETENAKKVIEKALSLPEDKDYPLLDKRSMETLKKMHAQVKG